VTVCSYQEPQAETVREDDNAELLAFPAGWLAKIESKRKVGAREGCPGSPEARRTARRPSARREGLEATQAHG
jgi:hypothetical protein